MSCDDVTPGKDGSSNPVSEIPDATHQIRPSTNCATPCQPTPLSSTTTAVSAANVQTILFPDGSRGTFSAGLVSQSASRSESPGGQSTPSQLSLNRGECDESISLTSFDPTFGVCKDLASLLDKRLNLESPAWKLLCSQSDSINFTETKEFLDPPLHNFEKEFDEIDLVENEERNEEGAILQWKKKWKHYFILSSAGKPIYSRHGDLNLINGYIGIIQTIISFFQDSNDTLMGFTAQETKFVVSTYGPLYLVAISRLKESDSQIRSQLEALYMQILSTLTLPTLTQLFTNRPNTDLRRPLEGTEALLSSLADTFTKGSPSALLSALECLKLKRSQRNVIDNIFLKARSDKLLYGLIVAGGKLVSVVRPKRHSLHPSDLQLIFNMLFEAGSVNTGGGENWIPICLPSFNNKGYLYMYVGFLGTTTDEARGKEPGNRSQGQCKGGEVAILLISTDKHSFFDLKQMRDDTEAELEKNGSLEIIQAALREDHLRISDIVPQTQLRHFLYKSRANVQFTMPAFSPYFTGMIPQRRLMTLYHNLHASVHAKHSHLKLLHCVGRDSVSLAWNTPNFEFYCVAGPNVSRVALTHGANKVIQWVMREQEQLFIIGGAVF